MDYTFPECKACGKCCYGVIMIDLEDELVIRAYLKREPEIFWRMIENFRTKEVEQCPFRDEEKGECLIYKVRPQICRAYGASKDTACEENPGSNLPDVDLLGDKYNKPMNLRNYKYINLIKWW